MFKPSSLWPFVMLVRWKLIQITYAPFAEKEDKEGTGRKQKDWSGRHSPSSQKEDSVGAGWGRRTEEEVKMARFWIHFEGSVEVGVDMGWKKKN